MAIHPKNPTQPGNAIAEIGQFLQPELSQVSAILAGILESESTLIREVGRYIGLAGGKKLRPMITLLFARAFGPGGTASPVEVAAALEAVHVATLLHDDVIDKAPLRRGQASVNARWGDDVAILMADYLYSAAFDLALQFMETEGLRLITQVTRRMCEGEMFQIERRGSWLKPEDYMQIISAKTAYLFSGCASLGCMAAGLTDGAASRGAAFGLNFGLAFQITDDTLDYTGEDQELGKRAGADLDGGKQTLPLILALEKAVPDDACRLRAAFGGVSACEERDGDVVRELIRKYGAVPKALDLARQYALQASGDLAALSVRDEVAFELLSALPAYVISRRS